MGSSVRPLAEHCRQLVIRQAPSDGETVSLRWGEAGEAAALATLERKGMAIAVDYRWHDGETWRSYRQMIGLKFDTPHLGGTRIFWRCSDCEHGARKLYDPGDGRFACKRCLGLAHQSQRQRTWRRALARATKVRGYLASDNSPADPFPERPRGMRRRTYEALRAEVQWLEALPAAAWTSDGRHVALGIRRSAMGASKRRWWPGRNRRAG